MESVPETSAAAPAGIEATDDWLPWLAARWLALAGTAVGVPLTLAALLGVAGFWPGRTFPGFLLLGNRIVPTVGLYSWTGIRDGVPFHSRVIAVDGTPVGSSAEVYERVAAKPAGTRFTYTLEKDGAVVELGVPSMHFKAVDFWLTIGIFLAFGIVSTALGLAVGFLQPWTPQARAFLVQGLLAGLFATTGAGLYEPATWWMIHPHLVAQATFPAALIHLGLVFPVSRRFVERRPGWLLVPYVLSAALIAWAAGVFFAEPPSMAPFYAMYTYSAAAVLGLLGLLAYSFFERRTPHVRRQLYTVLPGLAFGTSIGLYGFLNTARSGGDFPINLVAFTPFFFYLAVGYAIARFDLFDIDAVLKRALAYGVLTAGIILAYAGTVALAEAWLPRLVAVRSPLFTIVFVVLIVVLFEPARARVQHLVDRLFSRDRVDYRSTVSALSTELTRILDVDAIVARVGRTVHETFGLGSSSLLLWHPGTPLATCYDPGTRGMRALTGVRTAAVQALLGRRASTRPWWPLRDAERDLVATREAEALGADVVIPLLLGDDVIGAFALGRRRSGRALGRGDVVLLQTLAAQTAIAIGNAVSYRSLTLVNADLERKVAERTAELSASHTELQKAYEELRETQAQLVHSEKMASLGVLVAGVAHEINNPVSFIVGGLDPLQAGIEELRASAIGDNDLQAEATLHRMQRAVGAISRGAERTAGIVRDLRTFSRLGDTATHAIDPHEDIEVTLRLLHPRWADRITIHRNYAADLAALAGAGDELNQVWMNLLANACDAIEGTGSIWISTANSDGGVVVTVRDDGPGIHPGIIQRIFDPFFTTKPQGQGTGLGLAVSHGIVTRHRGRISVVSEPGSGTEVSIWLPAGPRES